MDRPPPKLLDQVRQDRSLRRVLADPHALAVDRAAEPPPAGEGS